MKYFIIIGLLLLLVFAPLPGYAQGGGSRVLQPGNYCVAFPLDPECGDDELVQGENSEDDLDNIAPDEQLLEVDEVIIENSDLIEEKEEDQESVDNNSEPNVETTDNTSSPLKRVINIVLISLLIMFSACILISLIGGYLYNTQKKDSQPQDFIDIARIPLVFGICLVLTGIIYSLINLI